MQFRSRVHFIRAYLLLARLIRSYILTPLLNGPIKNEVANLKYDVLSTISKIMAHAYTECLITADSHVFINYSKSTRSKWNRIYPFIRKQMTIKISILYVYQYLWCKKSYYASQILLQIHYPQAYLFDKYIHINIYFNCGYGFIYSWRPCPSCPSCCAMFWN